MSARRDKRKQGRLVIAGAIVAMALLLGWCGRGWFGGGDGNAPPGDSAQSPPRAETTEQADARCEIRVDATGLYLNGARSAVPEAVAACKQHGEAHVLITGDAVYGTVQQLEAGLSEADIRVFEAQRKSAGAP